MLRVPAFPREDDLGRHSHPGTRALIFLMSDWQRIQQIFLELVDLNSADRAVMLQKLCGDDADLRAEVESLLAADEDSGISIEIAVQDEAASLLDAPVLIGQRVGIYRVASEL